MILEEGRQIGGKRCVGQKDSEAKSKAREWAG